MKPSTKKETLWDSRATENLASGAPLIELACGKRPNHSVCCARRVKVTGLNGGWPQQIPCWWPLVEDNTYLSPHCPFSASNPSGLSPAGWQDRPMGMIPRQPDWGKALAWKHRISAFHPHPSQNGQNWTARLRIPSTSPHGLSLIWLGGRHCCIPPFPLVAVVMSTSGYRATRANASRCPQGPQGKRQSS